MFGQYNGGRIHFRDDGRPENPIPRSKSRAIVDPGRSIRAIDKNDLLATLGVRRFDVAWFDFLGARKRAATRGDSTHVDQFFF
jgi:hypothetical protein